MTAYRVIDAVNRALDEELARDEDVLLLGEDIGEGGGVFQATEGLHEAYNVDDEVERVFDTPLDESGIVGSAVGLAAYGKKPVAEIQFSGFMHPAFNQIVSHVSRYANRTRGRYTLPMVIRAPYGGGIEAPELHSESPEAYYAHTPGLKVVMPSTPRDAYGLLKESIRDPDPVIYLEPKRIYRTVKEELPDEEEDYTLPIGEADVKYAPDDPDVTVVSWGAMVQESLAAAEELEDDIGVEVVDLRSVSPIDTETVQDSLKKTGRMVVAHEAPRTVGVGAEVSARITEDDTLYYLEAPIKRVTGYDIVMPLPANEEINLRDRTDIIDAVETVYNC